MRGNVPSYFVAFAVRRKTVTALVASPRLWLHKCAVDQTRTSGRKESMRIRIRVITHSTFEKLLLLIGVGRRVWQEEVCRGPA